jgi:fatty-acyl-CoA synthase
VQVSCAALVSWCRERLARFKVPRWVFVGEPGNWPMTSTGKIQKFRLVEEAEKRIEQREG